MLKLLLTAAVAAELLSPAGVPSPDATGFDVPAFTVTRNVEETHIDFTVRDRKGEPVRGLTPRDFAVLQDGTRIPELSSFRQVEDPAVQFTLVLDVSESMRPVLDSEERIARIFSAEMHQESGSTAVVRFATAPNALAVPNAISGPPATGQTALYDTLCRVADSLSTAPSDPPRRQIVVVITDGEDSWSRNTLADTIASLQRAEVTVYPLTVHSHRLEFVGDRVMRELAAATGGRAYFLKDYRELESAIRAIKAQRPAIYQVAFRPPPGSGSGFHRLEVRLPDRKLVVRARSGYYLP